MVGKTIFGLNSKLTFGKHQGKLVKDVIESNASYILWCIESIQWFELDEEADDALDDALYSDDEGDYYWHPGSPHEYGDS